MVKQKERFLKKEHPFDSNITDNHEVLNVTVDYDRSVADGIKDGKYNWLITNITDANYPNTRPGTTSLIEVILVHYGKDMSTKNVLVDLKKRNLRPATLQELLAIGEQHPDKQRQFPIIALGSIWQNVDGNRYAPFLGGVGSDRGLDLSWVDGVRGDFCRFTAVRR